MSRLDAALKIARLYPVFPCGGSGMVWKIEKEGREKGKSEDAIRKEVTQSWKTPRVKWREEATQDEATIRAWWGKRGWEDANIGVPTGRPSGLFVLDFDVNASEDGRETARALGEVIGPLPPTRATRTASGGSHLYFKMRPDLVEASIAVRSLGPGIDWRGEGGFVIAPPSSDNRGQWTVADRSEPAELPEAWVDMIRAARGSNKDKAPDAPSEKIPEGQRNDALARVAGLLVNGGQRGDELLESLRVWNLTHCAKPLDDAEVSTVAASASKRFEEVPPKTDAGNARRFFLRYENQLRFVNGPETWHEWGGAVWGAVSKDRATELTLEFVGEMLAAAEMMPDEGRRTAALAWAFKCGDSKRMGPMREGSRSLLAVKASDVDANPRVLACGAATLYLDEDGTHKWRPPNPADLCTVTAGAKGGADTDGIHCPAWAAHLERVQPDADLRNYFQRAVGYSLVGGQREKCLFIVWGESDSGKSVTMRGIESLFGGYARATSLATFGIVHGGFAAGGNTPQLAALAGARLIHIPEIPRGGGLAADLVKKWTGGDTISAMPKYGHPFTFKALGKLWFVGNRLPTIDVEDDAAWRRVRLLHFGQVIPLAEQNPEIQSTWNPEGMLAWAIEGWRLYCAEGLAPPARMQAAADAERVQSNPVRDFIDECVRHVPGETVRFCELEESYHEWCRARGRKQIGPRALSELLEAEHFTRRRTKLGNVWIDTQLSIEGSAARGELVADAPI